MVAPSYEDEREFFVKYAQSGDARVRDELVERYVYIAEIIARRFTKNNRTYSNGAEYEDIYQVACLGLLYAADRYDPDKGVKFATFATPTIIGEVRKYFRDKGFVMRVPGRLYEIFCRAERIKRNGTASTVPDMARVLGVTEEEVSDAYKTWDSAFVQSIESELLGDDANLALVDTLGRDDNSFLVIENGDFIDYCHKQLDDKEREYVELRYYCEKSQREIGTIMNISQMQASRLERKILKKLRSIYFGD